MVLEVEKYYEGSSLTKEDGRVGTIEKRGHYGEVVSEERTDKSFVGMD